MPYDRYGRWYVGPSNYVQQTPEVAFYPERGMPTQLDQQIVSNNRSAAGIPNMQQQPNTYLNQLSNTFSSFNTANQSGNQGVQSQVDPDIKDIEAIQGSMMGATTEDPVTGAEVFDEKQKKGGKVDGKQVAAFAGGLISPLVNAIQPAKYDRRTGMMVKGTAAGLLGETSLTKIGSSISPGIGTAIGFALDLGKNAIMMGNEHNKQRQKLAAYKLNQGLNDRYQQPNYIGYAKRGMMSQGQIGNLEQDEIVIKLGSDGKYRHIMSTGPNHPSHEEGGGNYFLEEGSLVFPKKYVNKVQKALNLGDTKAINEYKEEMLVESTSKALQGEPYSNQSGIETQLQELSKSSNIANSRYGSQINSNMKKKYQMGGMVGQNPYSNNNMMSMNSNPMVMSPEQELGMYNFPNQVPAQKFGSGGVMSMPDMNNSFPTNEMNTGMVYNNTGSQNFDLEQMNTMGSMMQEMPDNNFGYGGMVKKYGYGGMAKEYKQGGMVGGPKDPPKKINQQELNILYNKFGKTSDGYINMSGTDDINIQRKLAEKNRTMKAYNDYMQSMSNSENPVPMETKKTYMPTLYSSGRPEPILDPTGAPVLNPETGEAEMGKNYSFTQNTFSKKKPVEYVPNYSGRIDTKQRMIEGGNTIDVEMPDMFKMGGMVTNKDGSKSKPGLWSNINKKRKRVGQKGMNSKSNSTVSPKAYKNSK